MDVSVSGLQETKKTLATLAGQLPFATSVALNKIGAEALAEQKLEMQRTFDRPTPYTLGALYKTKATKTDLETRTRIKSPNPAEPSQTQQRYVGVQIFGGQRKDKASERILRSRGLLPAGYQMVPGAGLRLDRYGNVSGAAVQKILASLLSDYSTIVTPRAGTVVIGEVGGTKGIWQVQRSKWKPLFIFVKRPDYERRLDYYGVSERTYRSRWRAVFGEAVDYAIRTAR